MTAYATWGVGLHEHSPTIFSENLIVSSFFFQENIPSISVYTTRRLSQSSLPSSRSILINLRACELLPIRTSLTFKFVDTYKGVARTRTLKLQGRATWVQVRLTRKRKSLENALRWTLLSLSVLSLKPHLRTSESFYSWSRTGGCGSPTQVGIFCWRFKIYFNFL